MTFRSTRATLALLGLLALSPFVSPARAAEETYVVNYRAGAGSPWLEYTTTRSLAQARNAVAELEALGYGAEYVTEPVGLDYSPGTYYYAPGSAYYHSGGYHYDHYRFNHHTAHHYHYHHAHDHHYVYHHHGGDHHYIYHHAAHHHATHHHAAHHHVVHHAAHRR
jgi:hypothetical protein